MVQEVYNIWVIWAMDQLWLGTIVCVWLVSHCTCVRSYLMVLGSGGSIRHGATLSKGIDAVLLGHSSKPDFLGGPLLFSVHSCPVLLSVITLSLE